MSWFAEWFNSPYYHILYKNHDEDEGGFLIDNLNKYLQFAAQHKILDLACGKGRHAIYLNSKGLDVLGVDLSPESIGYGKQFGNATLAFEVHDMREPVGIGKFDFVLNLFTSFGYFHNEEDNFKTIQSIATSLKPDGKLILDFFNAQKVTTELVSYEEKKIEGITFCISKKLENGFIIKTIEFGADGQLYHFHEKVRALYLEDFKKYYLQAGLKIEIVWGSYELDPYDLIYSDRLIMLVGK